MYSSSVQYIGTHDTEIDLFEGQYQLMDGVCYNSYVILDEKVVVMDTVDARCHADYEKNLLGALGGRKPDYLVVSHVEPDHASSLRFFLDLFPDVCIVGNVKTFQLLENYFDLGDTKRLVVREGAVLETGAHRLHFVTAPMVHWPEVMMTYEETEKILFSADAFGRFGSRDEDAADPAFWDDDARRYYLNIVGKYGPQVQAVLKKAAGLDIQTICPLHGPDLDATIGHVLEKYNCWSTYTPEDNTVLVAYASLYGNTAAVAEKIADGLDQRLGRDIFFADLARDDASETLATAFRCSHLVLCASTYNAGLMPFMDDLLHHLKAKNFQGRTVALVENGSWAPMAAKCMKAELEGMKNITVLEPTLTIRGALKESDREPLDALVQAVTDSVLACDKD